MMTSESTIHLAGPINTVSIISDYRGQEMPAVTEPVPGSASSSVPAASTPDAERLRQQYHRMTRMLQEAVDKLNRLYDDVFAGHHEAIARLSVEIARKVLMRNVRERDYEMESIIREALKTAPENTGLLVRLNPQDLADFQKQAAQDDMTLSGVELVADASIGRAECVVQSPKGMIKLLIEEHLEQISKALIKAE